MATINGVNLTAQTWTTYKTFTNGGWKDGFKISWSDTSDSLFQNTLRVRSIGPDANATAVVNQEQTGWKLMYTVYNGNIYWAIIYVALANIPYTVRHFNCNFYYLNVNGQTVTTSGGNWSPSYAINGVNGSGQVPDYMASKGAACIVWWGQFSASAINFSYIFSWVNTGFNRTYGTNSLAACYKSNLGSGLAVNASAVVGLLNTTNCTASSSCTIKASNPTVTTLTNSYASYSQTIYVSANYGVRVTGTGTPSNFQSWYKTTTSSSQSFNLKNLTQHIQGNTLTARSSLWVIADGKSVSGNTKATYIEGTKQFKVQYTPQNIKYTLQYNAYGGADNTEAVISINKLQPIGTNGYFNIIYINNDKTNSIPCLAYSKNTQFKIRRTQYQGENKILIYNTDNEEELLKVIPDSSSLTLNFGCSLTSTYAQSLNINFGEVGPQINNIKLMYPINASGVSFVYANQADQSISNFCFYVYLTQSLGQQYLLSLKYANTQLEDNYIRYKFTNLQEEQVDGLYLYKVKVENINVQCIKDNIFIFEVSLNNTVLNQQQFNINIQYFDRFDSNRIINNSIVDKQTIFDLLEFANVYFNNYSKFLDSDNENISIKTAHMLTQIAQSVNNSDYDDIIQDWKQLLEYLVKVYNSNISLNDEFYSVSSFNDIQYYTNLQWQTCIYGYPNRYDILLQKLTGFQSNGFNNDTVWYTNSESGQGGSIALYYKYISGQTTAENSISWTSTSTSDNIEKYTYIGVFPNTTTEIYLSPLNSNTNLFNISIPFYPNKTYYLNIYQDTNNKDLSNIEQYNVGINNISYLFSNPQSPMKYDLMSMFYLDRLINGQILIDDDWIQAISNSSDYSLIKQQINNIYENDYRLDIGFEDNLIVANNYGQELVDINKMYILSNYQKAMLYMIYILM